jgi:hypothetical protein
MTTEQIRITAKIIPGDPRPRDVEGAWKVTFGVGSPAAGMYSTIEFADHLDVPEEFQQTVARMAAWQVYGEHYGFMYPPKRPPSESTHRERIVVTRYERY